MTSSHNHGSRYSSKAVVAGDIDAAIAALDARIQVLEGTPPVPPVTPPPVTPPATGIPAIPAAQPGDVLRKDFADGTLAPFVLQDYPNVHEADYDPMLGWHPDAKKDATKRFRYLTQKCVSNRIAIHGGYVDLEAAKVGTDYEATFAATFQKNNGPVRTFETLPGDVIRFAFRVLGIGAASWQTPIWLLDPWNSPEVDVAEVIGGRFTFNFHGSSSNGQKGAWAADESWHTGELRRETGATRLIVDNVERGVGPAMTQKMPILIDAKYGLAYPDSTTPVSIRAQVAWIVVTR